MDESRVENKGFFTHLKERVGNLPRAFWDDAFLVGAIFLIALASFGVGRLSVFYGKQEPLKIVYPEGVGKAQGAAAVSATAETAAQEGKYVASLSGTKYHLPGCSGAKNIKPENKIWFATKEEAEIAGFEPAANCQF
jgi:hypothetical protein